MNHRTEVAGFMTILHGDDRIYNNIFVQKFPVIEDKKDPKTPDHSVVGTDVFDIFPKNLTTIILL